MSDKETLRRNITNGNFCSKDHYIDLMTDSVDVVDQCKRCPPGNGSWYDQGPPARLLKRIDDSEMDQLIQCSGGTTVPVDFLKNLDSTFDEVGDRGIPAWKAHQQAKNIKNCNRDPVTNVVENNETCQSNDSILNPSDSEEQLSNFFLNYRLFEKCVREKSREMRGSGEFSLMKQLTELSKTYADSCLDTLPPTDYCDIGYSEMFLSTPSIIVEENGYETIRNESKEDYGRTTRQMIKYAYDEELETCGDVSDRTRSLYDLLNKKLSFKFNIKLGDMWPKPNAQIKDYALIAFKWMIISLILYWVIKLIK